LHSSWIEVFGFVTGVINVWLLARQNIWNWPIGIANNLAYVILFATSGLYGDAGLQVSYIVFSVYGWILWRHPNRETGLPVTRITTRVWIVLALTSAAGAVSLKWFLMRFTDSTVPGWDGLTTALSLAATFGQARKFLESWWIWISVDLIYMPLYIYKDLRLTALLYFIFLLLCIVGLRTWQRGVARL
jgi:nicotinamide mononucleotide transporter